MGHAIIIYYRHARRVYTLLQIRLKTAGGGQPIRFHRTQINQIRRNEIKRTRRFRTA